MAGEINITVVGNLTDDPALSYTPSGTPVCNLRVAQTPRVFNRASNSWRDGASVFLTCVAWRDQAEHVAESLSRGSRLVVTGRLRQRSYETKEGEKRTVMEVEVDDVAASLRFTAVRLRKLERSSGPSSEDAWAGGERSSEPPF